MQFEAHGASHVGLSREQNEDHYVCGEQVFAVADGLGGLPAGEVASRMAVDRLAELDHATFSTPRAAQAALVDAIQEANQVVFQHGRGASAAQSMGTTITAAVISEDLLCVAHVGDSRAYLLDTDGTIERLTEDHTPVEEAVRAGLLTADQAARHPQRHMLNRAVGLEPVVAVDAPNPRPLKPGDRLLLCSDGLTAVVDDEEITSLLAGAENPARACEELVAAALDGGGPDNVTVVVVAAR